jgi:HK97 family phage prohead protease
MDLEHKYMGFGTELVVDGAEVAGYASLFGAPDKGGDVVARGAYTRSLDRLAERGGRVKMLWQHDPAQPIGVWDTVREDDRGLWVKGRILRDVDRGREAAALIEAGAIARCGRPRPTRAVGSCPSWSCGKCRS